MNRILLQQAPVCFDCAVPKRRPVAIRAWWWAVLAVCERQRQRRALARLDERLLRDVGIRADQARAEAGKLPWQD